MRGNCRRISNIWALRKGDCIAWPRDAGEMQNLHQLQSILETNWIWRWRYWHLTKCSFWVLRNKWHTVLSKHPKCTLGAPGHTQVLTSTWYVIRWHTLLVHWEEFKTKLLASLKKTQRGTMKISQSHFWSAHRDWSSCGTQLLSQG